MTEPQKPNVYYVVFCTTAYASFDDALTRDPATIAAHLARSQELHDLGVLVLAGAFLDQPQEPLSTMAVLTTREAAEDYVRGDPFVIKGMVTQWTIRAWAKTFA
jgi:uncharacterized protein YciI